MTAPIPAPTRTYPPLTYTYRVEKWIAVATVLFVFDVLLIAAVGVLVYTEATR